MEAEATKRETQFRLWHLFAVTAWVAVGATAWRLGFVVVILFAAFSLAGAIAIGVWLERWNAATSREGQRRSAEIGWVVFITFGLLLSVVFLELVGPSTGRERARLLQARGHLKNLALAVRHYEAQYGPLPRVVYDEAGRPMHSWRVLILPMIEERKLYERYRFEEPWDSPNNLQVAQKMPPLLRTLRNESKPGDTTDFLAVYDAAEADAQVGHLPPDAPSLMLVEVPASGILWTEPVDLPLDELPAWQRNPSPYESRLGAWKDNSVRLISPDTDLFNSGD